MIFSATLVNFLDRLTISVLALVLSTQPGVANFPFASRGPWFLVAYAASQAFSIRSNGATVIARLASDAMAGI